MSDIYTSVEQLIGNTPLLRLDRLGAQEGWKARVLAKLEYLNPGGSAQDRLALALIDDAEARGVLKPGGTIIEPTSGNTGIGLAMVAAARGYHVILTMPDSMSAERRAMLAAYGAQLVLTPGALGMQGSVDKASELAKAALLRPVDTANTDPFYAEMERDILERVNRSGVGPQGLGGTVTALACAIEPYPTHIASLPCAISIGCHITRHAQGVL